jgi:hypothetical protein
MQREIEKLHRLTKAEVQHVGHLMTSQLIPPAHARDEPPVRTQLCIGSVDDGEERHGIIVRLHYVDGEHEDVVVGTLELLARVPKDGPLLMPELGEQGVVVPVLDGDFVAIHSYVGSAPKIPVMYLIHKVMPLAPVSEMLSMMIEVFDKHEDLGTWMVTELPPEWSIPRAELEEIAIQKGVARRHKDGKVRRVKDGLLLSPKWR